MQKIYLDINVYQAAQKRLEYIFSEFDKVLIAFSGGKDSGVVLNMAYDYAKQNGRLYDVGMYHIDYEAQYQMTTEHVTETFNSFPEIEKYWMCLPVGAQCACRMDGDTWIPWAGQNRDIWVRDMPDNPYIINESNVPFDFYPGQLDYEVQDNFCYWYSKTHGKTAVLIGIRADESLDRYRAIKGNNHVNNYKDSSYIYQRDSSTFLCYPIYDWTVQDIWTYYAKFHKPYNRIYDLYYQAGLKVDQMRVASPFNDCAMGALALYKVIDPVNWGRMTGRVNGVNMAGLYGGTTAMGWKSITKPKHFTWKEYCNFLLNTLPEPVRNHYLEKLNTSIRFWKEKGGALSEQTIQELDREGIQYHNKGKGKSSEKDLIAFDDYLDDTDVTDFRSIPTYKRMCICIIKNDYNCKYMGFAQNKAETERRKKAIEKYRNI